MMGYTINNRFGQWDRTNGRNVWQDLASWDAFVEAGKAGRAGGGDTGGSRCDSGGHQDFHGGSFDSAVKMATTDGWDAALPAIAEALDAPMLDAPVLVAHYDVAGGAVDMGRYMGGEPECMVEILPVNRPMRGVSVLVPMAYSASVRTDQIMERGAAIAAVLEQARLHGITVTIYGASAVTYSAGGKDGAPERTCTTVRIGDSRGAYNPSIIAYALGHPTVLRRLYFGIQDGYTAALRKVVGGGRGMPSDLTIEDLPVGGDVRTVILPTLGRRDTTDANEIMRLIMAAAA